MFTLSKFLTAFALALLIGPSSTLNTEATASPTNPNSTPTHASTEAIATRETPDTMYYIKEIIIVGLVVVFGAKVLEKVYQS